MSALSLRIRFVLLSHTFFFFVSFDSFVKRTTKRNGSRIPITDVKGVQKNRNFVPPASFIVHDTFNTSSAVWKNREEISASATTRSDETVRSGIRNIPSAPPGYALSMQQRAQQFQYLKTKQNRKFHQNTSVDLFDVAILDACQSSKQCSSDICIVRSFSAPRWFGRSSTIRRGPLHYEHRNQADHLRPTFAH